MLLMCTREFVRELGLANSNSNLNSVTKTSNKAEDCFKKPAQTCKQKSSTATARTCHSSAVTSRK